MFNLEVQKQQITAVPMFLHYIHCNDIPYNGLYLRSANFRDFSEQDPTREQFQTIINSEYTCVMASDSIYSRKKTIAKNSFVGGGARFTKIGIRKNNIYNYGMTL